jgi:hypothetical protein
MNDRLRGEHLYGFNSREFYAIGGMKYIGSDNIIGQLSYWTGHDMEHILTSYETMLGYKCVNCSYKVFLVNATRIIDDSGSILINLSNNGIWPEYIMTCDEYLVKDILE